MRGELDVRPERHDVVCTSSFQPTFITLLSSYVSAKAAWEISSCLQVSLGSLPGTGEGWGVMISLTATVQKGLEIQGYKYCMGTTDLGR